MQKFSLTAVFLLTLAALCLGGLAKPALAHSVCELPSGIDEGERYLIKFKWDSKARGFKILDVSDCWILTFRVDGNHRWSLISDIEWIGSKEIEEK